MQGVGLRVPRPLRQVELAPLERPNVPGVRHARQHLRSRLVQELGQKLVPPPANGGGELRLVVREVLERSRSPEFLALKEHGRRGAEEQQCGDGSMRRGAGELVQSAPADAIGYLIVIFDEVDEGVGGKTEGRGSTTLLLPLIPLPLKEESPFGRGHEFLGGSQDSRYSRPGVGR